MEEGGRGEGRRGEGVLTCTVVKDEIKYQIFKLSAGKLFRIKITRENNFFFQRFGFSLDFSRG